MEDKLIELGYHRVLIGYTEILVYKHGNFVARLTRYGRRDDWRIGYIGKTVTVETIGEILDAKC